MAADLPSMGRQMYRREITSVTCGKNPLLDTFLIPDSGLPDVIHNRF